MPRKAARLSRYLFRGADRYHLPSPIPTLWAHVNNPVCCFNNIYVVLNHNDRVPYFHELMKDF
jgi:hypothetical protein